MDLEEGEIRSICVMDDCPGSSMAYGLDGQRLEAVGLGGGDEEIMRFVQAVLMGMESRGWLGSQ